MRVDAPAIVFLSQTATESLDGLARAPWWAVLILALLGGTAGIAKAWSVLAEYLRDKRTLARQIADEERARRDAKAKLENEQSEALIAMARAIPKQLEEDRRETRAQNELLRKEIAESTRAVNNMVDAWNDEKRILLAAIAQKLGIQNGTDETNVNGPRRSRPTSPEAQRA